MADTCSVCAHPKRKAIERAVLAGEPLRTVADRFGPSKTTLIRHRDAHMAKAVAEVTAARAAEVEAAETDVRAAMVEAGQTTLQRVRTLGDVAAKCLARVTGKLDGAHLEPGDLADIDFPAREVAALMGQSLKALELQAKLLGELQSGTQVNVLVQAERAEFVRVVLGALADEPAALAKVAAAVERAASDGGGR